MIFLLCLTFRLELKETRFALRRFGTVASTIFPRNPRVNFDENSRHFNEYTWIADMCYLYGRPLVLKYFGYVWDDSPQPHRIMNGLEIHDGSLRKDRYWRWKMRVSRDERMAALMEPAREILKGLESGEIAVSCGVKA